ncbi:triose-phosphate isomerase [Aestuariibacter sp. A3R04]|uniref:triose-phosphate isomerase n=1 Tax=Aestuariibacter sp. A3R04 TaxID=2841571 RepID=UPI001C08956B|nr:triose-phosphate isomerase [Aestuariibacter sp. A3R04]MBU3023021.1 triose-phosphate isomerase [Aestuariibacter sp. A3R04]
MNTVTRKRLVAGNWKMNGSRNLASEFISALSAFSSETVDVVLCPPAILISSFEQSDVIVGAQDVSQFDSGAHTGDLSVSMLADFGCKFCIVGHSERREDHGESNELVAEKALKVLEAGMTPIICCGEPLSVRESGDVKDFVRKQLDAVFTHIDVSLLGNAVIAYEPIWAIGTGKTASPEEAQDVHAFIRQYIAEKDSDLSHSMLLLYGGSVKPDNAEALFAKQDIDGGLIGGASLKANDFIAICQAAN